MPLQPDPSKRRIDVAIAIVVRDGCVLICQRRHDDPLGGFWEFPGGKREPNESDEQCLIRELREELAIAARPTQPLAAFDHDYPHVRVRLHPYLCEHTSGEPRAIAADRVVWVPADDLLGYKFLPANHALVRTLVESLTRPTPE
jgi:mutator protein MutT